ncbi:MAG: hypothetical protein B7X35_09130 [Halothiobacillus sp. 14-56-357]|jgi:hypothetical protein|nr:MAG: hypothetical protein B7X35_09130 [Halothiobacillus sp. 14-56-357]OZB78226.1 MAG: hypothetical protein B7X29_05785 [Halothiobacillus sp. 13-55-115]
MTVDRPIAPTDLRDYLKAFGWILLEPAMRDRLYVLENSKFPKRQIVFPMDTTAPDYSESLSIIFSKLAEMTGQSQGVMLSKVRSLKEDVLSLRVSFDGNDNSLPLGFAATLVQNTENLLKAAVCTVVRPRIHHPRLSLSEASQFIEKARFQQTERGSFVMKVACPVQALEVQGTLDLGGNNSPFVRQVILALRQSLVKLTDAVEADTLDKLVEELKVDDAPIISSNLCEAIVAMHDEQMDNSLDVAFDWSVLFATPQKMNQHPVRIQRDYFSRIEDVRRELRATELHQEGTFIGTVERLDGAIDDDGRRSGDVVLALLLPDEGETVRAKVTLSADDYGKADKAHMTNGAYIQVKGRLLPGRQPRQLRDISLFKLISGATNPQ